MERAARVELASSGYLLLSALLINPHNARAHSKRQIRQIAASIREFGFLNAILIDANNVIIAGHGRAEAAKLLAIELVPTIRVENLTEDQIRAYILADNRLAEKAGWDKEILAIELQHRQTWIRTSSSPAPGALARGELFARGSIPRRFSTSKSGLLIRRGEKSAPNSGIYAPPVLILILGKREKAPESGRFATDQRNIL